LWPPLRQAVTDRPQDLALVDRMEAEHAELAPQLAGVDAALDGPPTTLTTLAALAAMSHSWPAGRPSPCNRPDRCPDPHRREQYR